MSATDLVPEQNEGIATNTESSAELATEQEAIAFLSEVKKRLLHVNGWHGIAGNATADFQLTDAEGNDVDRTAKVGDHFRIGIPAPGSQTGEGQDWVRIEAIDEEADCLAIQVRPCTNPLNSQQDVAHFFSDSATSSFIVKRSGTLVTAGVYGRNEKPNTGAEKLVDKIRNTAVAIGAITGFSKLQWKSLVNALVARES